ncbi:outer membrane beta-barrel protein [Acidobacteriota bacterium]
MKKKGSLVMLSILFVFILLKPAYSQDSFKRFSLKISGGYGNMSGGDFDNVISGLNSMLTDMAALLDLTVTSQLTNVNWGSEFEGEFVFNLNQRFGVSLGIGYIRRSDESLGQMELLPLARGSFSLAPEFTAIPILLSGYYTLPIASKLSAFVKAGIGYYFVKLDYVNREETELLGIVLWNQDQGEAKDSGLGFHGAIGLEYGISQSIAFFMEGMGRYANFKDWEVDNISSNPLGSSEMSGKFWYSEEWNPTTNKYYPSIELSQQIPSGTGQRNVRKLAIGISGIVFKLGIRVRF